MKHQFELPLANGIALIENVLRVNLFAALRRAPDSEKEATNGQF